MSALPQGASGSCRIFFIIIFYCLGLGFYYLVLINSYCIMMRLKRGFQIQKSCLWIVVHVVLLSSFMRMLGGLVFSHLQASNQEGGKSVALPI